MKNHSVFLKTFSYVSCSILIVLILITGFIDPYGIIKSPRVEGINRVKPRMFTNARMVKAYGVRDFSPHGLILGSSRAESGLDPDHWAWPRNAKPVYNSALPSARIFEINQYLRHAHAQSGLTRVVLGLDFFMFDDKFVTEPGFSSDRLDLQPTFFNTARISDYLSAILSYDSLIASWETLTGQNMITNGYLENGSQDPRTRQNIVLNKGGHFAAFEAALKSSILATDGITATQYITKDKKKPKSLDYFRSIIQFCLKENIDLQIVISPVHAQWLETMWQLNKWDQYENWKRDIVQIVENADLSLNQEQILELWDFSGFNKITTEPVPKNGDKTTNMKWYWEASHYQRNTGNLILDKVLGKKIENEYGDFGTQINNKNIEQHLIKIRKERIEYINKHPEDIKYIKNLINNTIHLSKFNK